MEADLGGNRPQHEGSQTDELRDQYNRTVAIDLGVPQVKLIAPIVPEEAERGAILFPTTADSRDLMFITGDNFDPRGRVERSFGASSHISLEQLVAVCGEATGLSFRRNGSLIDFRRQGVERVEESEAIQQLLDHYVRQSVPETVRLAPELSKANGEVHYDGNGHALILHDAEDLRSVFLAYGTDSGIVGSMGPIEDLGRDRLSEGALR
ncbi:MAG: hypothetical protein KDD70_17180, partial [Bdellovibrionales bacterium]|nr:hypothetical protein [Bdellovibrionales bacterium]